MVTPCCRPGNDGSARWSAERKRKRRHARIEELDLELPIPDLPRLPDKLVHPLEVGGAVAVLVDVHAVGRARRLTIERHPEPRGRAARRRPHHEMQVTSVEPI